MGRITEDMIRRRAEHNEGMVSTLEEVALHQQNIEKIELLGQLCPHLKILYLQNNLIGKIANLHKLKELEYLNLAVNNVSKIQNLQRCESLTKLDLTINFVNKAGLLSVASLAANVHLKELYLMGNPCADWHGYRPFVVARLPQLRKLDGTDIKPSERIAAQQVVEGLEAMLRDELRAEGIDLDAATQVEDDSLEGEIAETGYMDEKGEMRRPWCAATRVLEHRENEKQNRESEDKKVAAKAEAKESASALGGAPGPDPATARPARLGSFPEIQQGERVFQRNEGKWEFTLDESADRSAVVLDVAVGKFLDTSLLQADIQPGFMRLLIKGKLLQLLLPCEVRPDASTAQRSTASGHLVVTMPKEDPNQRVMDPSTIRPAADLTAADADASTSCNTSSSSSSRQHGSSDAQHSRQGGGGGCSSVGGLSNGHAAGSTISVLSGRTAGGPAGSGTALPNHVGGSSRKGGGSSRGLSSGEKGGGLKSGGSVYNIVKGPGGAGADDFMIREVRKAVVHAVAAGTGGDDDDDFLPDL